MKPVSKPVKFLGLFVLLLGPIIAFYLISRGDHRFIDLDYFGPREAIVQSDGSVDTLYHSIPSFRLVNQFGDTVTEAIMDGKIVVADFFFSTCPTICPAMTKNMSELQLQLDEPHFHMVKLLSHTVNPVYDTPPVLLAYGEKHEADFDRWTFLTGDKEQIYRLGVEGYMLPAQEDALAPGGFLHSEMFVLIDTKGHIRGYYDGTKMIEMRRLINDIKILIKQLKEL
ncbi:MAG: SCO family protein [Cryomorphaceae bacterium]|nr:MAG: SCO family protein [Cryomorphaceae bacterium]